MPSRVCSCRRYETCPLGRPHRRRPMPQSSDFWSAFEIAASRIGREYFAPRVAGGSTVRRERVYTYELYHQLRCEFAEGELRLHGEMDKSNHPMKLPAVKPDLIVHRPGFMDENLVAIEVKAAGTGSRGLLKDLGTLTVLRTVGRYREAVLLVFGDSARPATLARIGAGIEYDPYGRRIDRNLVRLFVHDQPGSPPKELAWATAHS